MISYLLGHAVVILSGIFVSCGAPRDVFAFGVASAIMMCWPLLRDLAPVFVRVVWTGYWPARQVVKSQGGKHS